MTIKRIYHHYCKWECFHAGLYKDRNNDNEAQMSMMLLKQPKQLEKYMALVVRDWVYSSEVYLTYKGYNRQAWLGQAACCYAHGATEAETKRGWRLLTQEEMDRANASADRVIKDWEGMFLDEEIS